MKILLVAPPSGFTEQLRKALAENNIDVFYFNDRGNFYFFPSLFGQSRFLWRLSRRVRFLRSRNNRLLGQRLIEAAARLKPDIMLVNKGVPIQSHIVRAIKSMGITTANWFFDNAQEPQYKQWFEATAGSYDHVFTFDSGLPGQFLPVAIDPAAYAVTNISKHENERFSCDACFVGALYPERELMLRTIADLNLKIFGWKGWEKSSLARFYHGPLNIADSAKAYRCVKISININSEITATGVNLKTFEIPASGGFQLSDYKQDIKNLFVPGKEIAIFYDEADLREKVLYYLHHDKEREAIAKAGTIRVLRDHTLRQRVAQMLRAMPSEIKP